jgi:hypothetical protein
VDEVDPTLVVVVVFAAVFDDDPPQAAAMKAITVRSNTNVFDDRMRGTVVPVPGDVAAP